MFRTFLAVALFGLFLTTNLAITSADTADETAFKKLLVEQSPWDASWENQNGAKGTHKLRFKKDGAVLSGEFFGSDRGSADLPLKNLRFESEDNKVYVKFTTGQSPRDYRYYLEKNGTLKGDYEGMSRYGNRYTGEATATPAKR